MRGKRKEKVVWEDDGEPITNMNVQGMPWYRPENPPEMGEAGKPPKLTREEEKYAIRGALKAALLVAGVFVGVYFLFILFCDTVWLK